ncbi:hypothetical protein C0995_009814 [Termitomyces sp. Mi166|nr:hypothetical protein C0995_009814 [Termitomyces sp. Mi166\
MDALNALQQAEEFQQDFERHQNAAHQQATSSRVPLRALSDIETTTSKVVDEEELEILQLPWMPRWHVTIKEEVLERNVAADAESSQAVKLHMDHMHDHLNRLVDDSLGVKFKFPDGVKPHRAEGKHIWTYSGGHKFSQLEDWAMDVCYHLAACCYGGDDMDQEHIFVLHEFINGEARNWFCHHVLHTNWDKQDWTFKEVLIRLYNRFVNVATMQEACEAFRTAVYNA